MSQRGFVESETEQIYFESWGDGDEVVVLGHGLGGSHSVWYQQVPFLAQKYRVITWDQRGFGRSSRSSGDIGPTPAARDLKNLLDHLEINQAHILGQSMGGWSALGFTLDNPNMVRSLTLTDTNAGIFTEPIMQSLLEVAMATAQGPPLEELPIGHHPAIGDQLVGSDLAQAFLYGQLGTLTTPPSPAEIVPLLMTTNHTDRVDEVSVPTLFVVGENDPLMSVAVINKASELVAGSSVKVIPNTGHSPYFESPSEWNAAVGDFLDRVSP